MVGGGLGTADVQAIRDGLAAGRRPRVVFTASAGQIAGQLGQVVALADPAESEDWLVVRFGKDELPFSPGDLAIAPRGATARGAAASAARAKPPGKAAAPVPRPEPEFVIDKPVRSSGGRFEVPSTAGSSAGGLVPASSVSAPPGSAPPGSGGSVSAGAPGSTGRPAADGSAGGAPERKTAARGGRTKPPAGLTVTLAYAEGEWTVSAQQGSKVLARPYEVRPSEALRLVVALVDVPGVQEAVRQILSAERAEAQQRADRLRAELAEIEQRLAELPDAG